jgi:DNA-binding MarR family transcriptional regulator
MTAPAAAPSSPDRLALALKSTVGALIRAARATAQLAPTPAAVLDVLDRHGPMTTADLAAGRGVRHQTMAATVKELIDVGYLAARPDPADARKKLLALTPAGRDALQTDRRDRVAQLAGAIAGTLDDGERRVLARALPLIDRMTAAIEGGGPAGERGTVTGAW